MGMSGLTSNGHQRVLGKKKAPRRKAAGQAFWTGIISVEHPSAEPTPLSALGSIGAPVAARDRSPLSFRSHF
jgi:hypothetical protein